MPRDIRPPGPAAGGGWGREEEVVAVDSTHLKAYSQRSLDRRTGRSDPEARVGRGMRGLVLGYRVHTACCADSEMPLAFTVAPCNMNDKTHFKPLLERIQSLGVRLKVILADAQYSSRNVREAGACKLYCSLHVLSQRKGFIREIKPKLN